MFKTILTLLLSSTLALAAPACTGCQAIGGVTHTFYGFPDNDPAGAATSYDCGRNYVAGGSGTYGDPLTVATAPGELNQCEIIYDPYLKKYLRVEDFCAQCDVDWKNGIWHIDVWTGTNTWSGGDSQIACENQLTPAAQSQTIIRHPATNLPVDATSLYDGSCHTDHLFYSYNTKDYCSC